MITPLGHGHLQSSVVAFIKILYLIYVLQVWKLGMEGLRRSDIGVRDATVAIGGGARQASGARIVRPEPSGADRGLVDVDVARQF